ETLESARGLQQAGELLLQVVAEARLDDALLELQPPRRGLRQQAAERSERTRGGAAVGAADLLVQLLDDLTAELAGAAELLQLLDALAGGLLQQVPHRHAALHQLQDLFALQLLLRPGLAE